VFEALGSITSTREKKQKRHEKSLLSSQLIVLLWRKDDKVLHIFICQDLSAAVR
jgi:hypothetical protein